MKHINWRTQVLPHVIIVACFLALTFFFLAPLLQGKVLYQSDIIQWKGMAKEIQDYRAETGKQALWTNRPFAGMPAFLIAVQHNTNILKYVDQGLSLFIMNYNYRPAKILFLMFFAFYLGCIILGLNKWMSAIGAVAFALSTFFVLSLEAGHNTKIIATAYFLPVIASILFAYRKHKVWGAFLLAVTLGLSINANHVQITYYAFLVGLIIFIVELVNAVRTKTIPAFAKATAMLAVGALLAVSLNAGRLLSTYNHTKETIRGQATALSNIDKSKQKGGLDYDYAMSWSYGITETLTTLIPNFAGGASNAALPESSATYTELLDKGMPRSQAKQTIQQMPTYYGTQPFTGGPTYFGAVIWFLALLALLILPWKQKSWAIAAIVLSMFLAWGKNFFVSDLFFYYFPLYNKFRTPMMALTIAGVVFPLLSVMGLNWLWNNKSSLSKKSDQQNLLKKLYIATGVSAGICLLAIIAGGLFWSFNGPADSQLPEWLIEPLISDRQAIMRSDAIRSLVFILLGAGLVWLYIKEKLKPHFLAAGIALLTITDLGLITKRYLTEEDFTSTREINKAFQLSEAEKALQKEPGHFRVWNTQRRLDSDGVSPYTLNSLGGYSGAKLTRYQDLIDQQITKGNSKVLDMLNTKYVINENKAQLNNGACGNVWLSSNILWANNADEEMNQLNSFEPCTQVIVNERYKTAIGQLNGEGGTAKLTKNELDYLEYEIESNGKQLAVFSEIFYKAGDGWQAQINGESTEVLQVDFALRGIVVPKGNHKVTFKFNPSFYRKGETISLASSVVLLLLFGSLIFMQNKGKLKDF